MKTLVVVFLVFFTVTNSFALEDYLEQDSLLFILTDKYTRLNINIDEYERSNYIEKSLRRTIFFYDSLCEELYSDSTLVNSQMPTKIKMLKKNWDYLQLSSYDYKFYVYLGLDGVRDVNQKYIHGYNVIIIVSDKKTEKKEYIFRDVKNGFVFTNTYDNPNSLANSTIKDAVTYKEEEQDLAVNSKHWNEKYKSVLEEVLYLMEIQTYHIREKVANINNSIITLERVLNKHVIPKYYKALAKNREKMKWLFFK